MKTNKHSRISRKIDYDKAVKASTVEKYRYNIYKS